MEKTGEINRSKLAVVRDCKRCGRTFLILPGQQMRDECEHIWCKDRGISQDVVTRHVDRLVSWDRPAKKRDKKDIPPETCRIDHYDTVKEDGRIVHVEWRH